ncbi:MAG TPA: dihydropteroate synthase [bacterium]|nr:dihydropteroate synthase [bacterium]HOL35098.1 dihydropteroate synthase [bacterium]HPP08359.1 dihydropteroate synthase [bacterium]
MNIRILTPLTAQEELKNIDVHPEGIHLMEPKTLHYCVKISGVNVKQANVIKQEALAVGADAAIPYSVLNLEDKIVDIVIMATVKQYRKLAEKLENQFFNLKEAGYKILQAIENYQHPSAQFSVKGRRIEIKDFMIMGILNVTPDSFSDGGKYYGDVSIAVERAVEMEREGASIIDIGGESSRPGAESLSEEEEIQRVIPVIKKLRPKTQALISCDTSRYSVAKAALEEGVDIINDIYALRRDEKLVKLVAETGCGLVLMHMKGTPENMQKNPFYHDVISEISDFFTERINFAVENGVKTSSIIIDPGIGFGKRIVDNLEIINRLREFTCFGLPILLGTSRKSFIGKISNEANVEHRVPGTIASCIIGYSGGAKIFRVHDVKEVFQALKIAYAIENYGQYKGSCS